MEEDIYLDIPTEPADPEDLRQAMRLWATGVTVVTSIFKGVAHGMTVSSFTSVSLSPPQVLVSLAQNTRTHELIKKARIFGVTVLSTGQEELSNRFAGRKPEGDADRLASVDTFTLSTGVPLITDGIAHFDCRVVATFTSGTHTLFIGGVLAARGDPGANPLIYYNRAYQQIEHR